MDYYYKIEKLYTDLKVYVDNLYIKFLEKYEPKSPTQPPTHYTDYELEYKAYCLLVHSAFEEYFENIAINLTEITVDRWEKTKKVSISTLALLGTHGKLKSEKTETNNQKSIIDNLSGTLLEIINTSNPKIRDKNNTIYLGTLRELLTQVGVDITNDVIKVSSLNELIKARGDFAHKSSLLTVVQNIQPHNMKEHVDTCLEICEEVKNNAINALKIL